MRWPPGRPTHRPSPDLIRGLLPPSTRVEESVDPGSAAGEVRGGAAPAPPLESVGWETTALVARHLLSTQLHRQMRLRWPPHPPAFPGLDPGPIPTLHSSGGIPRPGSAAGEARRWGGTSASVRIAPVDEAAWPPHPPAFPGLDPGPIATLHSSGEIRRPRLCGRGSAVGGARFRRNLSDGEITALGHWHLLSTQLHL